MMTLLIILAMIFVLAPLADGLSKRLARPKEDQKLLAEVARLRDEVDRLTAQLNRLEEEQSFMVQLLSEGAERPVLPPRAPGTPAPGETSG